jgi:hypothetical protein
MSSCDLISSLKDSCLDDILAIREDLGASLAKVYLVTRTWTGSQVGDGSYSDEIEEVLPTPGIKNYSHNVHVMQGGAIQQGDLLLQMISKSRYPNQSDINCSSSETNIEKFYRVGEFDYRLITIVEKHLVWDVQVRRLSDQTRRANG